MVTKNKHKKPKPREVVIERLNFDENQIVSYDKLIKQHQKQIMEKEAHMIELKKELFSGLIYSNDNPLTDSLLIEIGKTQEKIEKIHYSHFEDIKRLCKDNQLDDFNKLANELTKLFSHRTMTENERK